MAVATRMGLKVHGIMQPVVMHVIVLSTIRDSRTDGVVTCRHHRHSKPKPGRQQTATRRLYWRVLVHQESIVTEQVLTKSVLHIEADNRSRKCVPILHPDLSGQDHFFPAHYPVTA